MARNQLSGVKFYLLLDKNKESLDVSHTEGGDSCHVTNRQEDDDFVHMMTQGAAQHSGRQMGITAAPCLSAPSLAP
jgi:hypothetical protein